MKLIKKIARKILFKKKTKIGGYDLDDKGTPKEADPIFWTNPTTTTNSTIKDIKITPSDPKDMKLEVENIKLPIEKPTVPVADKKPQPKKPGRPKGSATVKKQGVPTKKNITPKKK